MAKNIPGSTVSRDDNLARDSDLVAQMQFRGIEVFTVQHFLERLADGTAWIALDAPTRSNAVG